MLSTHHTLNSAFVKPLNALPLPKRPIKPTLAEPYRGQNPNGWLMSEKLDGVRALWDGQQLKSRSGKVFHAPDWFIQSLPNNQLLDGELWAGHGLFQQTVGRIRAKAGDWSGIKFMVFDVVNSRQTYTQRMDLLHTLSLPDHCQVVKQYPCYGNTSLDTFEHRVLTYGGEGVMLRNPDAPYEHKRSDNLLKIKRFKTDEATVVGYTQGQGRLLGTVGALICQYADKTVQIGSGLCDNLRRNPPAIGSKVSFQYFELTQAGVPRHPSFIAVRDYE